MRQGATKASVLASIVRQNLNPIAASKCSELFVFFRRILDICCASSLISKDPYNTSHTLLAFTSKFSFTFVEKKSGKMRPILSRPLINLLTLGQPLHQAQIRVSVSLTSVAALLLVCAVHRTGVGTSPGCHRFESWCPFELSAVVCCCT